MNKELQQKLEALETQKKNDEITEIVITSPDGKVTATIWKRENDTPAAG